jgi:hypothetical protein
MSKPTKIEKTTDITDSQDRLTNYFKNFPIDIFDIPRPFKSNREEISDYDCVFRAFCLLGLSPEMWLDLELEPIGWLKGPHLIDIENFGNFFLYPPNPLKSMLTTNPWSIVIESPFQLAIAILRAECDRGSPNKSNLAKKILKDLGLSIFISESAQKRRSDDLRLRYYYSNPDKLISYVTLYEFVIKKYWNPPYKSIEKNKKKKDIEKAFRLIFKQDMPNMLIIGERDKSPSNIALAFISHETGANYESLKKIFYEETKNVSESDIYHNLDFITDNKGDKISFIDELKRKLHGIDSER